MPVNSNSRTAPRLLDTRVGGLKAADDENGADESVV